MADLSKLSDEELKKIYQQKVGLVSLSDDQLKSLYKEKSASILDTAGQVAKEAVNPDNFPMYGQAIGEAVGAIAGPKGMMLGAGVGQAAGESVKDLAQGVGQAFKNPEQFISDLSRLPTKEQVLDEVNKYIGQFNRGVVTSAGGQILSKGLGAAMNTSVGQKITNKAGELVDDINQLGSKAAEKIRPSELKLNSKEIVDAGKLIGVDVTPAMLDKTDFVGRLEYTLANSPSYLGQSVKAKQQAIADALKNNIEDLTKSATSLSPNQLGNRVKAGMMSEVGQKLDPAAAAFQDVLNSTSNIPVNEKSISAITRNIENIPSYRLTKGAGKPSKYVEMIKNAQNANDLKEINTMLNSDLRSQSIDSTEKFVLGQMKDKISKLETNSIMRSAIQQAKEGGMKEATGKKIGTEIVDTLKGARKAYRELSTDLQSVAKDAGLKVTNPKSFIDAVEELPSEKIQDKFFNVDNNRLLSNLKTQFPDEFELLKQGKMSDILQASKNNAQGFGGEVSAQRFMTQVRNLNPEAQSLLFSDDGLKTIAAIDTIQKNIPKNFNPSSSGTQAGWQEAILRNFKDIPTYVLYKGGSSNIANNVRGFMLKVPRLLELSKSNPESFNKLVTQAAKSYVVSYPKIVRNEKTKQSATVFSDEDLKEAQAMGFK